MPRKKGSLNKPKAGSNLFVTKFEKQIEGSAVTKKNALGWVNWGERNDFPNLLLNLYNQSPTHRAAINFGVQSILGNGVDEEVMEIDGSQIVPNYAQTWDDMIRCLALDYLLYGSYAIQIIKNKDNKTFSFWHIPLEKVRWTPFDEDGQITKYYISSDWTAPSQYVPVEIDAFDMRDESLVERGKPYLYVYKAYSPAMSYYTQPHYQAAIKAIQSEIEYLNYDLKTTINGFVPSGMLVLDEVETDEEKQAILNNITRLFQGSDNANTVMISFRRNQEETKPEFIPFTQANGNVNLFDSANQRTISRILAGHQIPNASLIGLPDIGNTGFASEADKLETAYQLYNKLVGNNNRMAIIKTVNQMLAMNGVDTEIIMKPLNFNDFDDDANVKERTETTVTDNDVEVNDEEKVDGSNTVVKGFKQ